MFHQNMEIYRGSRGAYPLKTAICRPVVECGPKPSGPRMQGDDEGKSKIERLAEGTSAMVGGISGDKVEWSGIGILAGGAYR